MLVFLVIFYRFYNRLLWPDPAARRAAHPRGARGDIYFQPRIEGNFDLNVKLSMFPSQFDNKLTGGNLKVG